MDKRNLYDLTHFNFNVGRIGRLQTLAMIPVVAGDSLEVNLEGLVRLSPLRRYLSMDVMCDIAAFYIPHRHAYGEDWLDFIKDGIDENVTFPTVTPQNAAGINATTVECLGHRMASTSGQAMPKWLPYAYLSIWNRFFRHPPFNELDLDHDANLKLITDITQIPANGQPPALANADQKRQLQYGVPICLPMTPWTTGNRDVDDADREVSIASNKLDILDLEQVKGRYKTEVIREWFARRYNDVLSQTWDSQVNIDADERPELVMRTTRYLSGEDVNRTDEGGAGSYVGKGFGTIKFAHPRKYFPEHGSYWIVAALRFPLVTYTESHPMAVAAQPSYKDLACDPEIWMRERPQAFSWHRWHGYPEADAAPSADFKVPYGQWYRYHPSRAHSRFAVLQGFPFITGGGSTFDEAAGSLPYYRDKTSGASEGAYDQIFQTQQLEHYSVQARIGVMAHRFVPDVKTSIFAGTK